LAQSENVVVYGSGTGVVLVAPYFIEQFVSRNNAGRVLDQVFQRPKLLGREQNRLTLAESFHGAKINAYITKRQTTSRIVPFDAL
jgi:hypothetical protein